MTYKFITPILSLMLALSASQTFSQTDSQPQPALSYLSALTNVRDFTLSVDKGEAYFTIQSPGEDFGAIVRITKKNNKWSEPELLPFSGTFRDIEPFLSPDGLRLYFSSNRPLNKTSSTVKDYDIWYVERKDSKSTWSEPVNLGQPVNTANNEFYPALTKSGNLYFTSDATAALSKDDIYFSKWDGKSYSNPQAMDNNINSAGYEFNAYISPDENTIIYTAYDRQGGMGSGDLYISHRDTAGKWSKATNMGPGVNSKAMDYCPFLDIETNTLYFTSRRNSIKVKSHKTIQDYLLTVNQYENGLSRIYKVQLK